MIYHVTCNTDDNYAQHCCAMLCSLFENNKDMVFHVHILTHGLATDNASFLNELCHRYNNELTIYDVDESKLDGVQFRKSRPLTKAAYYRTLLPEILPGNIERVLYLDCDMIVVGSVKELFELELDGYALAATLDCMPWNSIHRKQLQFEADERSFCSGIMMINIAYWRKYDVTPKLLDFSKRKREPVYLHDQDAFNYLFKKDWYLLPPKWNKASNSYLPAINGVAYFDIYEYVYNPKIIHFSSQAKPWLQIKLPYSDLYRKYLNISEFPNPVFKRIATKERIKFYTWNFKYYFRKYIIPFIPNVLLIILGDVIKYLKILYFVGDKKKRRDFMLKEGLKAL